MNIFLFASDNIYLNVSDEVSSNISSEDTLYASSDEESYYNMISVASGGLCLLVLENCSEGNRKFIKKISAFSEKLQIKVFFDKDLYDIKNLCLNPTSSLIMESPITKEYSYTVNKDRLHNIELFYKSELPLLFTGESGVGKTYAAKKAHLLSSRNDKPFLFINCSAIPESIAETELFGSVTGAFTGARNRAGLFECADGGTVFLDEIGELSLNIQKKLLKVIEEGTFSRVGSSNLVKTDVRIISATNADLQKKIKNGEFREDLFYRISVVPLHIKPLRERTEEIPSLVELRIEPKGKSINSEAMDILLKNPWKGNIRELFSCLDRAIALTPGSLIDGEAIMESLSFQI